MFREGIGLPKLGSFLKKLNLGNLLAKDYTLPSKTSVYTNNNKTSTKGIVNKPYYTYKRTDFSKDFTRAIVLLESSIVVNLSLLIVVYIYVSSIKLFTPKELS
ncbi:hypothetical protein LZ32DRAFT_614232 [Colletotrichum eremochloae]|nr:hypothetical protein LZ32DRAFT_614232 [Colletotrichum eremochloae]